MAYLCHRSGNFLMAFLKNSCVREPKTFCIASRILSFSKSFEVVQTFEIVKVNRRKAW